jgi:uncharacterized membrane protein (DUF4010 family)
MAERLWYAIKMAVAFQAAMLLLELATRRWASSGLFTTAALVGITDVDALAVSMTRLPGGVSAAVAARAITIGVVANTVTKAAIALVLGTGRFRLVATGGLLLLALAAGAAVWLV